MTTQDIVRGVDFTVAGTLVNASTLNQHVDLARPGADKGLIIETEDTGINTPVVPDPNIPNPPDGVTPLWWKRYQWKRIRHEAGGALNTIQTYTWNEAVVSDPVYLKWVSVNANVDAVAAIASGAAVDATAALAASGNAQNGVTVLGNNLAIVTNDVENLSDQIALISASIAALNAQLSQGIFRTGDMRPTFSGEAYSTLVDEGWLLLNGASVLKATFANLFGIIGSLCLLDGADAFFLPDLRGRAAVGAGAGGGGLTDRIIGTTFGTEEVTLTALQCSPAHQHKLGVERDSGIGLPPENVTGEFFTNAGNELMYRVQVTPNVGITQPNVQTLQPHANMQPSIACNWLIKT